MIVDAMSRSSLPVVIVALRALLVYLNEVPPPQTGEAQKLHLHLATRLDLPPEYPQSNLRAQYTALGRLLPTRPELGRLVGEFVRDRRAEPSGSQTPAPVGVQRWGGRYPPARGRGIRDVGAQVHVQSRPGGVQGCIQQLHRLRCGQHRCAGTGAVFAALHGARAPHQGPASRPPPIGARGGSYGPGEA